VCARVMRYCAVVAHQHVDHGAGVGQLKYKRKGVITTSTRPCMVVLFNDALMWTKPSWRYEGEQTCGAVIVC